MVLVACPENMGNPGLHLQSNSHMAKSPFPHRSGVSYSQREMLWHHSFLRGEHQQCARWKTILEEKNKTKPQKTQNKNKKMDCQKWKSTRSPNKDSSLPISYSDTSEISLAINEFEQVLLQA